jgi:hypothetical protein
MGVSRLQPAGGANDFTLDIGSSGDTTFELTKEYAAGAYSITSQLADASLDIYLINADGSSAGYTNSKSLTATKGFNKIVVYGATTNDLLVFEYKTTFSPTAAGNVDDGAAPFLTSATPTTLEAIDDTTTVTGGNFADDVEIVFTGQDDVDRAAKNIVRSSSTSLIVARPDVFPVEQEPYTMTATNAGIANPSVGVNVLTDYFDAGGGVTWVTTSPLPDYTPGVVYSETLVATDADGLAVSYAVTTGTLPSGLSLNSSTGEISGTVSGVDNQTFTVTATDTGGNSSVREFSLTVATLTVTYLVVAGGGGGGGRTNSAGGGGAGGYRCSVSGESSGGGASAEDAFTFELGTSYTVTVGAGGAGGSGDGAVVSTNGSPSSFTTINTVGGGSGAPTSLGDSGRNGGSGGGARRAVSGTVAGAGTANEGFAGGTGSGTASGTTTDSGGGGGGAGAAGQNGVFNLAGLGGSGLASSITGTSVARAGGGAGLSGTKTLAGSFGGGGGTTSGVGENGEVNTGSGGGASTGTQTGGAGGSGVVILSYLSHLTITVGAGLVADPPITVGGNKVTVIKSGTGNVSWAA